MASYNLKHLQELEAESIYIIREVAAQFENPALLFSGGKDSIVCYHLARKAFYPANVPFPLMHIDTGHNFDELYKFRDNLTFNISSDPADLNRVVSIDGALRGKKRKSLWVSGIINRGNNNNIAIMNYKDQSFNVVKGDSVAGGVIVNITPTEVTFNKNDKTIRYNLSIHNTLD